MSQSHDMMRRLVVSHTSHTHPSTRLLYLVRSPWGTTVQLPLPPALPLCAQQGKVVSAAAALSVLNSLVATIRTGPPRAKLERVGARESRIDLFRRLGAEARAPS